MCEELKSRRDYVMKRIGEMDMICVKPEGAFYVFPYFNGADGHKLADELLEKGVVPGSAVESQGEGVFG